MEFLAILAEDGGLWSQWLWPILQLLIGLGLVIFFHELGHFAVAKWVGIKVERFAIGMGPRVVGFQPGETDYCICALPLGGYVKMLGQDDFAPADEEQADPRAFNNKSVGARFAVISAGVIMNVILAALLFVFVCLAGIRFPAPVIGGVVPGYPAAEAPIQWDRPAGLDANAPAPDSVGLEPGDEVTAVKSEGFLTSMLGKEVNRFDRLFILAALADRGETFRMNIRRQVEDSTWTGTADVGVKPLETPSGGTMLAFGIESASDTVIGDTPDIISGSPFQPGDRVLAIAGTPVEHVWDIPPIQRQLPPGPVTVEVERTADGRSQRISVTTRPQMRMAWREDELTYNILWTDEGERLIGRVVKSTPVDDDTELTVEMLDGNERTLPDSEVHRASDVMMDVLGMTPRFQLGGVLSGSPADRAGLLPGDVVLSYGDRPTPTFEQILQINQDALDEGTTIVVQRDGKALDPIHIVPAERNGRALSGTLPALEVGGSVVAYVRPGSPADRAGIQPGDRFQAVNGQPVADWGELLAALADRIGQQVTIQLADGEIRLDPLTTELFDPELYRPEVFHATGFVPLVGPEVRKGPIAAIGWGVRETTHFIIATYGTLKGLLFRTVSPTELHGPVGITQLAIKVGRQDSIARFVYFMAMISVSLAVVNFLPIPVVDGGHAVLLGIEKIRGKPVPVKVMNAVQMAGLALLLLVFVAITWNDVARILRQMW